MNCSSRHRSDVDIALSNSKIEVLVTRLSRQRRSEACYPGNDGSYATIKNTSAFSTILYDSMPVEALGKCCNKKSIYKTKNGRFFLKLLLFSSRTEQEK